MSENGTENQDQPSGVPKIHYPEELKNKARVFFKRASEVAYALQYDYAIEMYLDGLGFWPDALEEGHVPLREIALKREESGGKKSGMMDRSKYAKISTKNAKDAMLKAEYLLGKDPKHTGHMTDLVKAALEGDFHETALWMSHLLFDYNLKKDKPSVQTYVFLRDSFTKLEEYPRALQACQAAINLKPGDSTLQDVLRDLSAQATMQHGKYDEDGDFRDSIQDREVQERMQSQELLIRSEETQSDLVEQARKEYEAEPDEHGKLSRLVDLLCDTEDDEQENEAISLLESAYVTMKQFRYKQRSGTIKIKQLKRNIRHLNEDLAKDSSNELKKKQLEDLSQQVLGSELDHYKLCVANYPTDLGLKYEYARRLLQGRQFDEAIPVFQLARSDPRFRVPALNAIGQCFFYKEWYADAVDTFEQALESVETSEDNTAKELRYNLGRAYEADGKLEEALQNFRKIAQIDFNYRDVRDRVNALRTKMKED
jgi:tetratricopeptide (TPR) repeat protein